ncbi:E3 ubiquitin protein ligase DRIP2 [Bienertia sinuspersici]
MMMIGESSNSNSEVAKVKVNKLVPHLTCPLCNQLFNECTTISECLHNWAKCSLNYIRRKKDNNIDNLRAKLFPNIDAKKSKEQVHSSQEANMVKPPKIVQSKKKEKSLSSLVDDLPKTSSIQNITTKKRSSKPRSTRKITTTPLQVAIEPSKMVDQSNQSTSSSSIPSSENVVPKNKIFKQQTKGKEKVGGPWLYDLNKLPTIIEDDENPSEALPISETNMEKPLLRKNEIFEFKAKADEATKKTFAGESSSKKQVEKNIAQEKTMKVSIPRDVDLNKLPSAIGESSSNNSSPTNVDNAISHLNKNGNTINSKGKEKEIIDVDKLDEEEQGCRSYGWFNREQPNFRLYKNEASNASNYKGKGKMIVEEAEEEEEEDQIPLSVFSSKKTRGKRLRKVVQPQLVQELEDTPLGIDLVVDVTHIRPKGVIKPKPIWFSLVSITD